MYQYYGIDRFEDADRFKDARNRESSRGGGSFFAVLNSDVLDKINSRV